jgi:cation:H+ antiporter
MERRAMREWPAMEWLELLLSLFVILVGAELFTNGVEWVGEGLGISEGAVGSVLAAIGTALPETLLPVVAILSGNTTGQAIGIGAILGAPFMLTTLAMFALGLTVVIFSRTGRRSPNLEQDPGILAFDLQYFLVMYGLAFVAGILHVKALDIALAVVLLVGYALYVRRHFRTPGEEQLELEAAGEVKPLYASRLLRRRQADPSISFSGSQTMAGLAIILGGAELFVRAIATLGDDLHVSHLAFALLLAPIATELPEALNSSAIWARRGKDVLALGNVTGAMVFQATFPVSIGLLFTPWRLNFVAGTAAAIALVAGVVLFVTTKIRKRLLGWLLLAQGAFYVGFVIFVLRRI